MSRKILRNSDHSRVRGKLTDTDAGLDLRNDLSRYRWVQPVGNHKRRTAATSAAK